MKHVGQIKTLYVDIDDTLAMGNLSDYDDKYRRTVTYTNGNVVVIPNTKNINLMIYFYRLGYEIIAWSKTGADWAKAVCESFELDQYVSVYLSKPMFYLDDKDVTEWIGPRRWRDCK